MVFLRRNRQAIAKVVSLLSILGLGIYSLLQQGTYAADKDGHQLYAQGGRHLLQQVVDENATLFPESNCTPPAVDQFPDDFLTPEQRAKGGVAFHILLSVYLFCALAVVCDDYFVASLESICDVLGLQADVAGATFMAFGSSAPELTTAVVGLFLSRSELRPGTIIGSGVFNLLVVIGICGLGSGMIIYLTWWPMIRDCVVYVISICVLVGVVYDEQVHWFEALAMVLCYVAYLVFMYFNKPVGDYLVHAVNVWKERQLGVSQAEQCKRAAIDERTRLLSSRTTEKGSIGCSIGGGLSDSVRSDKGFQQHLAQGGLRRERRSSLRRSRSDSITFKISPVDYEVVEYESPLIVPDSILGKAWWVLMLPVTVLLMLTIPDCRRPGGVWKRMFIVTFAMAVVWIAGLSYVLVWMVTVAGATLGIPDSAMSLTFVALSTSVPDALSSLFVARDGYGDMAVANAIGSNVCDLLLCLGLPWLLKTGVVEVGAVLHVSTPSLLFVSLSLVIAVMFLLGAILLNGWKLNKKFGAILLVAYLVWVTIGCLYELDVVGDGDANLPPC